MPPEAGWVLTAPQTLFHLVWSLWCITIAVLLFAVNFVCDSDWRDFFYIPGAVILAHFLGGLCLLQDHCFDGLYLLFSILSVFFF